MDAREFLGGITPPLLMNALRDARRAVRGTPRAGFTGDYPSWEAASAASGGYDSAAILEKTRAALAAVRDGRAVYERDSVLFDEVEYSWPLAAGLLRVAALDDGELGVLDFGGSLGSTYFQNRALLADLRAVRWSIVEQPDHVRVGAAEFASDELHFATTIAEATAVSAPNCIVLGSVLQYLPQPYTVLDELMALPCDHVLIDRTPFIDAPADRLCVQQVDPWIYDATYPAWLLSHEKFLAHVDRVGWRVVAQFPAIDTLTGPVPVTYRGMILERKQRSA